MILISFVDIKVSLTGLSKFKERISKIRELLSLRKGISLHLQEIKIDYPRKRKGNHFWQWKQTFELDSKGNHQWSGENGSNGVLKDKSCNFQGERNNIIVITISRIELEYKKLGKLTNYNSAKEIFMTQSILLKWNEMKFLSPWKLQDLSLSIPFDPFSPLHWWFPLESSCHCQKWLPFRFLG